MRPAGTTSLRPSAEELLQYILTFRTGHRPCRDYYIAQMPRLMSRLDYLKDLSRSSRMLEIGAPPFNTTLILRKLGFLTIECTNYNEEIGDRQQQPSSERMSLYSPDLDEWQHFDVHTFDVEKDPWPYEDQSFDIVMGFEILEHLTRDPMHMFSEANRVTRQGGLILLSTPNIVSARNLIRMLTMLSPGEHPAFRPAKAPGARHNREWTPREVSIALEAAGYEIVRLEARMISGHGPWLSLERLTHVIAMLSPLRGDHIYALARKVAGVRDRFPVEERLYYYDDAEANRLWLEARTRRAGD